MRETCYCQQTSYRIVSYQHVYFMYEYSILPHYHEVGYGKDIFNIELMKELVGMGDTTASLQKALIYIHNQNSFFSPFRPLLTFSNSQE